MLHGTHRHTLTYRRSAISTRTRARNAALPRWKTFHPPRNRCGITWTPTFSLRPSSARGQQLAALQCRVICSRYLFLLLDEGQTSAAYRNLSNFVCAPAISRSFLRAFFAPDPCSVSTQRRTSCHWPHPHPPSSSPSSPAQPRGQGRRHPQPPPASMSCITTVRPCV